VGMGKFLEILAVPIRAVSTGHRSPSGNAWTIMSSSRPLPAKHRRTYFHPRVLLAPRILSWETVSTCTTGALSLGSMLPRIAYSMAAPNGRKYRRQPCRWRRYARWRYNFPRRTVISCIVERITRYIRSIDGVVFAVCRPSSPRRSPGLHSLRRPSRANTCVQNPDGGAGWTSSGCCGARR